VRVLIFLQRSGATIHCAAARIASGANPADNYWRTGNMLGAIELIKSAATVFAGVRT
jgi:hypothetical protein